MAIYVDFVGLNTLIQEPVNTTTNEIGHLTSSNMTSSRNTSIESIAQGDYLVALNLHRNGPYGWPTFKQIRNSDNAVIRKQRRENVFSHFEYPGDQVTFLKGANRQVFTKRRGPVTHYTEVPIVSKHKPLKLVGSVTVPDQYNIDRTEEVEIFNTLGNETQYFSNNPINNFFNASDIISDGYENFIDLYLAGGLDNDHSPIDEFKLMKYSQVVFPREKYTYKNYMRQRPSFDSGYWKSLRSDRTQTTQQNGFGFLVLSQSMWVLDGEEDFTNLTYEITPGNITLSSPENYVFGPASASATSIIYVSSAADPVAYHFDSDTRYVSNPLSAVASDKTGNKTDILLDKSMMPTTAAVNQIATKLDNLFTADGFSVTKTVNISQVPCGKRTVREQSLKVPYYDLDNSDQGTDWQTHLSSSCLSFWLYNEDADYRFISGTMYQEVTSDGKVIRKVEMQPANSGTLKVTLGTVLTKSNADEVIFDADAPEAFSVTFQNIYGSQNPYGRTSTPDSAGVSNPNKLDYTVNRPNHFMVQFDQRELADQATFLAGIDAKRSDIVKLWVNGTEATSKTVVDTLKFTHHGVDYANVENDNTSLKVTTQSEANNNHLTASNFTNIQPFTSTGLSFSYWVHDAAWDTSLNSSGDKLLLFNIKNRSGTSYISHFVENVSSALYLTTAYKDSSRLYYNRQALATTAASFTNGSPSINGNGPWQRVAYTLRTGSANMDGVCYVDNVLKTSTWVSGSPAQMTKVQWAEFDASTSLTVFDNQDDCIAGDVTPTQDWSNASIDELTFWNGGLTSTQLQALYNGTSPDPQYNSTVVGDYPSTETSLGLQANAANQAVLKHSTLMPEMNATYDSTYDYSTLASSKGHQIMPLGSQYTPANFDTNVIDATDTGEMDFACWIKPTHNAYRTRGIRSDGTTTYPIGPMSNTSYFNGTNKGLFISLWYKANEDPGTTSSAYDKILLQADESKNFFITLKDNNLHLYIKTASYVYYQFSWSVTDQFWSSGASTGWKHVSIQWNGLTGKRGSAQLWINNTSKGVDDTFSTGAETARLGNTYDYTYLLGATHSQEGVDSEISQLAIITDPKDPTSAASMRAALYNSGQHPELDSSFVSDHLSASTNTGLASFNSYKRITSANSIYYTSGPNYSRALRIPANNYIRFSGISNTSLSSVANRGGMTLSYWWKIENGTANQWMGSSNSDNYFKFFEIRDTSDGRLECRKYGGYGGYYRIYYYKPSGQWAWRSRIMNSDTGVLNKLFDGDWHHILFTWDGRTDGNKLPGNFELYIDGTLYPFTAAEGYATGNSVANQNMDSGTSWVRPIDELTFMSEYSTYDCSICDIKYFNQYLGDGNKSGGSIASSNSLFTGGTAHTVATATTERANAASTDMLDLDYEWTSRTSTAIQPPIMHFACSDYAGDTATSIHNRAYRDPTLHTYYPLGSEVALRSMPAGTDGNWPVESKIREVTLNSDSLSDTASTLNLENAKGVYLAGGPDWSIDNTTVANYKWGQVIFSHHDSVGTTSGPEKGITLALTSSNGLYKLKSKIDRVSTDMVLTSNAYLSPNKWYHIYAKYAGLNGTPSASIYVDGVETGLVGNTGAGNYSPCTENTVNVNRPGVSVGGVELGTYQPFCGFIQDICFWTDNDTDRATKFKYSAEGIFSGSNYIDAGDSKLFSATRVGYNQGASSALKAQWAGGTATPANTTFWRDDGGSDVPSWYNMNSPKYLDFTEGSNTPTNLFSFWWKSGNIARSLGKTERVLQLVGDEVTYGYNIVDNSTWSQIDGNRSKGQVLSIDFYSDPTVSNAAQRAYLKFSIKNKYATTETQNGEYYQKDISTGVMYIPWASASATTHYAIVHDQDSIQLFINGSSEDPITLSDYSSGEVPTYNTFMIGDETYSGIANTGAPLVEDSIIDEFALVRYYNKDFGSTTRKVIEQGSTNTSDGNLAITSGYNYSMPSSDGITVSFWVRLDTSLSNPSVTNIYKGLFQFADSTGDDIFRPYINFRDGWLRIYGVTNNTSNQMTSYYSSVNNNSPVTHSQLMDGNYHLITMVFYTNNSTRAETYVDGQEFSVNSWDNDQGTLGTIDKIEIMTTTDYSTAWELDGSRMTDFAIWDMTLSSTEITELYNLGQDAGLTTHSRYLNLRDWWLLGDESSLDGVASGASIASGVYLPSQINPSDNSRRLETQDTNLTIRTKPNTYSTGFAPIVDRIYNGGKKYNFAKEENFAGESVRNTVLAWWRMGENDSYATNEILSSVGQEVTDASLTSHDLTTVYGSKWKVVDTKNTTSDLTAWYKFNGASVAVGVSENTLLASSVSGAPNLILKGAHWEGNYGFDSLNIGTKKWLVNTATPLRVSFTGEAPLSASPTAQLRPSVENGSGISTLEAYKLWIPEIALFPGMHHTNDKTEAKTTLTFGSAHTDTNSFKNDDKIYFLEDPHSVHTDQHKKTITLKTGNADGSWSNNAVDVALSASSTARTNAQLAAAIEGFLDDDPGAFGNRHDVSVTNNVITLEAKTAGGDGQYEIIASSSRGSAVTITSARGHSNLAKALTSAPQFAYRQANDTDYHRTNTTTGSTSELKDEARPYIWLRGYDFGSASIDGYNQRANALSSEAHHLENVELQDINACGINSGSTMNFVLNSSPSLDLDYITLGHNKYHNIGGMTSFTTPGQPLALIGGWDGARARKGPGVLQNNYNQFTQGIVTGSNKALDTQFSASACYFRRHSLTASTSILAPFSGFLTKLSASQDDTNSRTKLTGSILSSHLYLGSAKWEAGNFAGKYNDAGSFIKTEKAPFFNTYSDFVSDARPLMKSYGIVPEFRMSDHVEKYMTLGPTEQKLDLFNVYGGLSTANRSDKADFYTIYSTTDFLKHFEVVQEDHSNFVDPYSIKLKCSAVMKFLPYDGFYPAQRTVQIAQQFYESYKDNINITGGNFTGSVEQNSYGIQYLLNPLFSPGILFNTIKAGVACDYPLITDTGSIGKITGSQDGGAMITQKFDTRIPFEALAEPEKYLANLRLASNEPDPNGDTGVQIEWGGQGNELYHMMVSNFMAETAEFFLQNKSYTTISSLSQGDANFGQAQRGKTYMMRLRMYRAIAGSKTPVTNSAGKSFGIPQDSTGVTGESFTMYSRPSAFGPPQKFNPGTAATAQLILGGVPTHSTDSITLTVSGKTYAINFVNNSTIPTSWATGSATSYSVSLGINNPNNSVEAQINIITDLWNKIPSYSATKTSTSSSVITANETIKQAWDITTAKNCSVATLTKTNAFSDFVPTTWNRYKFDGTERLHDFSYTTGSNYFGVGNQAEQGYNYPFTPPYYHGEAWADITFTPEDTKKYTLSEIVNSSSVEFYRYFESGSYGQKAGVHDSTTAINDQAMQLASSVNIFSQGVLEQDISAMTSTGINSVTTVDVDTDITNKYRWIIQTKFETPMLNFQQYTYGTGSGDYGITLPGVGPMQTPIGMWHQYGHIPQSSKDGVFLQVSDVPGGWIKNAMYKTEEEAAKIDSLASLCGFSTDPVRMGEIDGVKQISEAVVAIPFYESNGRRHFFSMDRKEIKAALDPARKNLTGQSIIDMVEKMNKYVLPPSMDFITNEDIRPFSIYIFEFTHNLTKLDLADIWQNLPPDISTSFEVAEASITHRLLSYELLGRGGKYIKGKESEVELLRNDRLDSVRPDIQWMVFKAKRRGKGKYFEKIFARNESQQLLSQQLQLGTSAGTLGIQRDINYNWPYDYFSLIEGIRLSTEIEFAHVDDISSSNEEKTVYSKLRKFTPEEIAQASVSANDINKGISGTTGEATFERTANASSLSNRGQIDRERRVKVNVQPTKTESRDADSKSKK